MLHPRADASSRVLKGSAGSGGSARTMSSTPLQLDAAKDLAQAALARIACPPARRDRPSTPNVVLVEQQHLDREVGMGQQRREGGELVEHLHHRPALRRAADRHHLALLVDAHDPPLGRDRMHDPDPVLVKQRVELGAQRTETAGLHLHQFPVGADEIDHEPPDRHLEPIARRGQHRLDRSVQRPLAQHTDTRHASQAKGAPGDPSA